MSLPCTRASISRGSSNLVSATLQFILKNIAENSFSVWRAGFKCKMVEVRNDMANNTAENQATWIQLAKQNLAHVTTKNCAASVRAIAELIPRIHNLENVVDNQP